MKLWDKGYTTENIVERFTVGKDRILDLKLAKYDVLGNMAHAKMLEKIGILSSGELKEVLKGLEEIMETIKAGTFTIEDTFEDVHSKIEYELIQRIGEAGKKIHTARSRNDQVLLDLRLYLRDEIQQLIKAVISLQEALIDQGRRHLGVIIPGYTHLQRAQPVLFSHHLLAYFVLAILLNLTLLFQKKSRLLFNKASLATLLICIIYGALDEVHQIFIPGRYAEFLDWLADFAGVILGIFLVYFLKEKSKYQIEFN